MSKTWQEAINPTRPAGAYFDLLERTLPTARDQRVWEPSDGPMPSLFISHGAPPTLDDAEWLGNLNAWAQSMPKPRAIVVVSAHWETAPPALSATDAGAPLFYDFGGFHPLYYTLPYATPDASDLAYRVASALEHRPVHQFTDRGLDHGAFIPLMAMYPAADVPVVQLSMPSLEPSALLSLGQRLRELKDEGVLVIGSGFMTHSFAALSNPGLTGHLAAFDEWATATLSTGDVDALVDYEHKGPGARIAHPTADHFVPLLLTLGASNDPASAATAFDGMALGNSIRSIQVA